MAVIWNLHGRWPLCAFLILSTLIYVILRRNEDALRA
jgi:hypothetical protein